MIFLFFCRWGAVGLIACGRNYCGLHYNNYSRVCLYRQPLVSRRGEGGGGIRSHPLEGIATTRGVFFQFDMARSTRTSASHRLLTYLTLFSSERDLRTENAKATRSVPSSRLLPKLTMCVLCVWTFFFFFQEPGQDAEDEDLAFAADVAAYFSKARQVGLCSWAFRCTRYITGVCVS